MKKKALTIAGAVLITAAAVWWTRDAARRELIEVVSEFDERIQVLSTRLAEVSAEVEPVHRRCEVLSRRMDDADGSRASIDLAVKNMSSTIDTHEDRIARAQTESRELGTTVARVRDDVIRDHGSLQARVDEQDRRASELETALRSFSREQIMDQAVSDELPAGSILPWIPQGAGLPKGWVICDGSLGTPDLRGVFLRGVGEPGAAGRYGDGARMSPAGEHSHATDTSRNVYILPRGFEKSRGDWLLLFDTGVGLESPAERALHGSHVHEDEHLPAHVTVVFIMKESEGG